MPYTFAEMDGRKGYAAGMPFPAYYQTVWTNIRAGKDDPYGEAALDFVVRTARYARKTGGEIGAVSIPDEANALGLAKSLARLRGKKAPGSMS
jgi:hypothetical protein